MIKTWKNLDKDGDNFAGERQILTNKIRVINKQLQGNDSAQFNTAIDQFCEIVKCPGLFHVKIITKIFELITAFGMSVMKRPNIVSTQDYNRLFDSLGDIMPAFSENMQKNIKELQFMDFSELKKHLLDKVQFSDDLVTEPQRVVVAETVLSRRTTRISLVLDRCYDIHNIQAVLRTAECLGVQNVWIVEPVETRGEMKATNPSTKGNHFFLTIRRFKTSIECVDALKAEGIKIWVTDLAAEAVSLDANNIIVPDKVAIVIGREADGCSDTFKQAADKRIYLPLHGFTESLNLSVAAALVLQKLFVLCPEARGDIKEEEKKELRARWFSKLASSEEKEKEFEKYIENPATIMDDLRRNTVNYIPTTIAKRVREKEEQMTDCELSTKKHKVDEGQ